MRTYTIFILSICFIVLNIQGQEKIEFNRSKINDKVLLYQKSNSFKMPTYPVYPISVKKEGTVKFLKDFQQLLKKEFPNISDNEYSYLKKIVWQIWILPDGSYRNNHFMIPEGAFDHINDLEMHLAHLVTEMTFLKIPQDQLNFMNPKDINSNLENVLLPFFYLRKEIDDK